MGVGVDVGVCGCVGVYVCVCVYSPCPNGFKLVVMPGICLYTEFLPGIVIIIYIMAVYIYYGYH